MSELSVKLLKLGFFSALGTVERLGIECDPQNPQYVRRGTPNTWDYNNGTTVVYDELARPWIIDHTRLNETEMNDLLSCLRRGAYVPHANDGGAFMLIVLPTL